MQRKKSKEEKTTKSPRKNTEKSTAFFKIHSCSHPECLTKAQNVDEHLFSPAIHLGYFCIGKLN